MLVIIWQYKVKHELFNDFEALYSTSGKWVSLFKRFNGFIKTELLKKQGESQIYFTIDYWESDSAYRNYLSASAPEYAELDAEGELLTEEEIKIGMFEVK